MPFNKGLINMGIPALDLGKLIYGYLLRLVICEDNQLVAKIVRTGKSQESRHIHRIHGITIVGLNELLHCGDYKLADCQTQAQAVDMFMKLIIKVDVWKSNCTLMGILDAERSRRLKGCKAPSCTPGQSSRGRGPNYHRQACSARKGFCRASAIAHPAAPHLLR